MATGVKPRDEDHQFTKSDIEALEDAMKNKKFRDLLGEYFEEIRDPVNQDIYQKEMTQLEKERGYDITFINPKGRYVIKTSVAGDRKAFINICSNENVSKPSYSLEENSGRRGMKWSIPYSLIPPREDYDQKRQKCVIYDVVFHPDTLRMAEVNKQFRELVNNTAFDALKNTYKIELDCNNIRFPKSLYKGITTPAVIRKEDPNYIPPSEEEISDLSPEMLEKLYPQKNYPQSKRKMTSKMVKEKNANVYDHSTVATKCSIENTYTTPKYVVKQQKAVDFQDYTFDKNAKQYSAIPSHLNVEINLPLLSSSSDCTLDVEDKKLSLVSEKPAKYKLNINLPYSVDDKRGTAKFDVTKRVLSVTLPVIQNNYCSDSVKSLRTDSGVDSEECPASQSDEDSNKEPLITELTSSSNVILDEPKVPVQEAFLDPSVGYLLPTYTHNVLDDMVAFTFHVKNTDPESVVVKHEDNKVQIKFISIGSGYVPIHYTALIIFDECVTFENVTGEAWDNNVILQMELASDVPQKYCIGISEESSKCEYFDVPPSSKPEDEIPSSLIEEKVQESHPTVEVTNSGSETSILVSSNNEDVSEEKQIVWVEDHESNTKSILRKTVSRSLSESSMGEISSSMDYISSDCIPEESSLKKTVRFSHAIARQFYRYINNDFCIKNIDYIGLNLLLHFLKLYNI